MRHVLFNLLGCDRDKLNNKYFVEQAVTVAAKKSKSLFLGLQSHKFEPQGVTAVALLAESHISIHTWPELGFAVCDVFTCGKTCEPMDAALYLNEGLEAEDIDFTVLDRNEFLCYNK